VTRQLCVSITAVRDPPVARSDVVSERTGVEDDGRWLL
jgi:hypothetical protein